MLAHTQCDIGISHIPINPSALINSLLTFGAVGPLGPLILIKTLDLHPLFVKPVILVGLTSIVSSHYYPKAVFPP